jgi:hypothetical protein
VAGAHPVRVVWLGAAAAEGEGPLAAGLALPLRAMWEGEEGEAVRKCLLELLLQQAPVVV